MVYWILNRSDTHIHNIDAKRCKVDNDSATYLWHFRLSVDANGGYRYFLTFTDDLSRYGYIYLMKHKFETFEKFKEFQSEVENHRNKKIKFLWSDHGGEYLSYEFGLHLKQCGIVSQLTTPEAPQRNGVSERRNHTLLDMVRSMMSLTNLPLCFGVMH